MPAPATLRRRLVQQLAARQEELRAQLLALAPAQASSNLDVHDQKDLAAQESQLAIEDATMAHAAQELALVSAALRRLEDGSYGICQSCGESIEPPRLIAVPEAVFCATCQRQHELRGHH